MPLFYPPSVATGGDGVAYDVDGYALLTGMLPFKVVTSTVERDGVTYNVATTMVKINGVETVHHVTEHEIP